MEIVHYENYKVRYCECDAFGYLRSSNYLIWMQETAFAASAALGYDFAKYQEIGRLWLVRETDIEYLTPLRADDVVTVKTWVTNFHRFRSRRAYEMRKTKSGQLVARAWTDWIFMDTARLRPVLIPEEMQEVFLTEGVADTGPGRQRTLKAVAPAEGFSAYRTKVAWSDIDSMWHVNNANYLRYIEDADGQAGCADGGTTQQMVERGIRVETRHHRIEYRQAARLDDELEIVTWCSDVTDGTFHQHYEIRRLGDGALLTQAQALRVIMTALKKG